MKETRQQADRQPGKARQSAASSRESFLFAGAYSGNIAEVERVVALGVNVDAIDPETGLSALHIAVGSNDIALCRYLIEKGRASFFPDRFGRWPTLVAAECRVDDELSDYIVEKEASFLAAARTE